MKIEEVGVGFFMFTVLGIVRVWLVYLRVRGVYIVIVGFDGVLVFLRKFVVVVFSLVLYFGLYAFVCCREIFRTIYTCVGVWCVIVVFF